jgi:hypothetical protein
VPRKQPWEQLNMDHQQRILTLAADMGADPKEVDAAIRVMQSGRTDLLIEILATA